jgi:hypothetical protein
MIEDTQEEDYTGITVKKDYRRSYRSFDDENALTTHPILRFMN